MMIPARIFVTGANGFIGRALMARFRALGSEVRGVDLAADTAWGICAGNITEAGAWQRHMAGSELVFHTAAVVSNNAPLAQYRSLSVGGVHQVINAAIAAGASRVIHLSSIAAYGLDFTEERIETSPLSLMSGYPYCDAKAASEHPALAAHAAGEMACTIIRPGDVYGPGSRPWVLLPLEMMKKHQFLLPENGQGIFSPVYIDNLLDGVLAASLSADAAGQIFNITDGAAIECREFFGYHHRWLGRAGSPPALPTPIVKGITRLGGWLLQSVLRQQTEISDGTLAMLTRKRGYSIAKARKLLGYEPTVSLTDGMAKTEAWLRERKLLG